MNGKESAAVTMTSTACRCRRKLSECLPEGGGILFGAVGGDQWDHLEPSLRPEKAILGLRKSLGLYVNLRPVKIQDSMIEYSPLKPEIARGTDIMIVRELVGGIYFGKRCESEINDGVERAWDVESYSVPEVERITRCHGSSQKAPRPCDKRGQIQRAGIRSRLWRRTAVRVHDEEYPDIQLDHMYVDNCAQQFAIHPSFFDVVVTNAMFGDILSDEAAITAPSACCPPLPSERKQASTNRFTVPPPILQERDCQPHCHHSFCRYD